MKRFWLKQFWLKRFWLKKFWLKEFWTRQFRRLIRATMLSTAIAGSAQAIPLSSLLAGGTLNAGGLAFTDFSASHAASDPLRAFNAANIDVTALTGEAPAGARLRFNVRGNELSVQGDGVFAFVGVQMRFRVSTLDPANTAMGAAVTMDAGTLDLRQPGHGVYIADYPASEPGSDRGGNEAGELLWNFPIQPFRVADLAGFAPQAGIWAGKNVLVWAVDRADTAALVVFSQRFNLELPEPGSLPLLAIAGLVAATVLRMRRPAM